MNYDRQNIISAAHTVRGLVVDAVEVAQTGHTGLPLGASEVGTFIYSELLQHHPGKPDWINRDRFVLSAGHGSMMLYSLLHLCGYGLSLEDLKEFRQLGSLTPGHPEYGHTTGVETTTGPLGQGFATAVGMAIAEQKLAHTFNTPNHSIIDHYTYVLASDGDLMEGVSAEAASFAGGMALGKLIVFYDHNKTTIDGKTHITSAEDVGKRFEAYGWEVFRVKEGNIDELADTAEKARNDIRQPTLIMVDSIIGKGAKKENTNKAHGGALGPDDVESVKKRFGLDPKKQFYIPDEVKEYFKQKRETWEKEYHAWKALFEDWKKKNPELYSLYQEWISNSGNIKIDREELDTYHVGDQEATRNAAGKTLQYLQREKGWFFGGSADLTWACYGTDEGFNVFSKDSHAGNYIFYGVREHAMGSITSGITLHSCFRSSCATFLAFSDYMRPAIRMAALMKLPVIYTFSHDTVLVGPDGPTHQPVEHLASLRVIPNLTIIRPGDAQETIIAWQMALDNMQGPTALITTRQDQRVYEKESKNWRDDAFRGAYCVKSGGEKPDKVIVASGSEVDLAIQAIKGLSNENIRVVSLLSQEIFLEQDKDWRESILPMDVPTIYIEGGSSAGWAPLLLDRKRIVSVDTFGTSGPVEKVGEAMGLTQERIRSALN